MASAYDLPSIQTLGERGRESGVSPTGGGICCIFLTGKSAMLLGNPRFSWRKIAWPNCCGELTAVKTGYLLTSITWPYLGLRGRPMEFACFFLKLSADKLLIFKWSQTQVQNFNKCKICISNRLRTRKFSQFLRPIHTRGFAPGACSRFILYVSVHTRERFQVCPWSLLLNI